MTFRFLLTLLVVALAANNFAQARRVASPPTDATTQSNSHSNAIVKSPAEMYEEAKTYTKRRFDEFGTRKVPYSNELRETTIREQKQLAARYAAQLNAQNPRGEDFYYLGSLQVLAENNDGASDAFQKYLDLSEIDAEKAQTARSLVAVTLARKREFNAAEKYLSDYLKFSPVKIIDQLIVERELAKNYRAVKNYEKAVMHAESAVSAARPTLKDSKVEARLLKEFSEVGLTPFEIYEETKATAKAVTTLENLRETAVATQSINLYTEATDRLIPFLIEVNRKPEALENLKQTLQTIETKFSDAAARARIANFLRRREKQYRLLGETAPEIVADRFVSDESQTLSMTNLRGKVVLIDFWATWCKPCFAAFPHLIEWNETYNKKGLQILGITRYYGRAGGYKVDDPAEYTFLQKFRREQRLPYPFVVAKDESNHRAFASQGLPTTILIDRKGVVRYVQTGVGLEKETEEMIKKLIAED